MRRLLNYQRVTENNARAANRHQWMKMNLENMRAAEKTHKTAAYIETVVAYAGYLFRVQNEMTHYRPSYYDGHLHNSLVDLLNTLGIPVEMVVVQDRSLP